MTATTTQADKPEHAAAIHPLANHTAVLHNALMDLSELYGARDAADYAGVSLPTLRHAVQGGTLEPIALSQRVYADGRVYPYGFVFTRRMLDAWRADGRAAPTEDERRQVFNSAGAAEYLGISVDALKQAYHVRGSLAGRNIGGAVVFLLRDLIAYSERERPFGPEHPRALFSAEQVREMRELYESGVTIREIANRMDLDADLTTIHGVVYGRTYRNV
jgi:hypothetical protein